MFNQVFIQDKYFPLLQFIFLLSFTKVNICLTVCREEYQYVQSSILERFLESPHLFKYLKLLLDQHTIVELKYLAKL